ncbi:hypothetical protein IAT38_002682 [Cryptococcus sp. DSM 104549]
MADATIAPLPRPTSTTLRSSLILPSLPQILSELLQNSLDAGATRIDCWVDLTKGGESLRVVDDGAGIGVEGLKKVGKRFRTSKGLNEGGLGPVGSYGFRGEALASIASLSLLDITTRTTTTPVLTKILKSSKTLYEGPNPNRYIAGEHGTTVVVREIFHSLPVRREELAKSSSGVVLGQCRKVLEKLALGNPGVGWEFWEEGMGAGAGAKRALRISQTKTSLDVFKTLYGNALVQRIQKIRVSSGKRRVDGFISISGDVTKAHQHLYINSYPLDRGDLHMAIAKRFANSKFSSLASAGEHDEVDDYSASGRRSPRRLERHPVYVLNVSVPPGELDVSYEPRKGIIGYKDLESLKTMLLAVIDEFLRRNGFAPARTASTTPSPTKRPSGSIGSPIARPAFDFPKPSPSPLSISSLRPRPQTPSAWPLSRQLFERKTPATVQPVEPASTATPVSAISAKRKEMIGSEDSPRAKSPRVSEKGGRKSKWIEDLLAGVDTGVFPYSPSASSACHRHRGDSPSHREHDNAEVHSCTCHRPSQPISLPPPMALTTDVQFPRSALKQAKILGQVDRKFVAAVMQTTSGMPAVALIDQHAADERVSVERILGELCKGFARGDMDVAALSGGSGRGLGVQPMIILTRAEGLALSQPGVLRLFERWGIHLSLPEVDSTHGDYVQVGVEAVPSVLAARLGKKEAVEMTRLVRGYLAVVGDIMGEIESMIKGSGNAEGDGEGDGESGAGYGGEWGRVMRFMPKEMLELANSKACRGAIMFEDRLTLEQCHRLVEQLAQTKFPFMCAHGRPSMVPLLLLKQPADVGERKTGRRAIDWKGWKGAKI